MQTKGYKSCEHIWLKSIYVDLHLDEHDARMSFEWFGFQTIVSQIRP